MSTVLGGTARVESALHGPAHADAFRVKVGRFGDRFYHDPLPACDVAPVTDETWPSVTTIKKAAGGDWSWVSLERAAQYLATRREELKGLNAAEIHARLNEVNKAGLNRASGRGTAIHNAIEAMAAGQTEFPEMTKEATPYLPVARAFLDDHQPEWLYSEVVAVSRQYRYAGTLDAIVRINGKTYLVDWKTRKVGKHGAYDEEAWQCAAYAKADYLIVDDGHGEAKRAPVPKLDGALIVSLTPEGYRIYPALLDAAWESFRILRAFWDAKRVGVLAKPIILKAATVNINAPDLAPAVVEAMKQDDGAFDKAVAAEEPAPVLGTFDNQARRLWLLDRAKALNEQGHGKSLRLAWSPEWAPPGQAHKWTDDLLPTIERTLDDVERQCEAQFPTAPPVDPFEGLPQEEAPKPQPIGVATATVTAAGLEVVLERFPGANEIHEGAEVSDEDVAAIAVRMKELTGKPADLVRKIATEMTAAKMPLQLGQRRTQRRYEIAQAVLAWAVADNEAGLRAALGLEEGGNLGVAFGWLSIEEAQALAAKAMPAKKTRAKKK